MTMVMGANVGVMGTTVGSHAAAITGAGGRKRVSVDMLIAETLGERKTGTGTVMERERGVGEERAKERAGERTGERGGDKPRNHAHGDFNIDERDPIVTPSTTEALTPVPARSRNHSRNPDNSKPHAKNNDTERSRDVPSPSKSRIKSEDRERDRWEMGMGVLDVGCEGDKKKRLNRQSANYGSKAVACVHCRGG
jgi:hypothetical protein